jgi:hypothetical protein
MRLAAVAAGIYRPPFMSRRSRRLLAAALAAATGLIGATHSQATRFWELGRPSSDGIA